MHRSNLALIHTLFALSLCAALTVATPVSAQEEEEEPLTWSNQTEFSFVSTSGNAEATTLGLRSVTTGPMGPGRLVIGAGALRAESDTTTRLAIGTPVRFTVEETSVSEVTAENYFLRGRYEQPISERLFWFAGAGWERNEFAGIKNRISIVAGIGHLWYENESGHFRTSYGVTYTDQEDVIDNPAVSDTFAGLRLGWDYLRPFGANTSYGNLFIVDANLDETSDYRADMLNWLDVSMSERFALRLSLQFLYDNEPSLTEIPLFLIPGVPTGTTVLAPLDDLDTLFTVALVVNF